MRLGRRIAIAVAGGAVVFVGAILAMPLVPGPGIPLILLGLGILSLEFERPRIWLAHLKARGVQLKERLKARRSR
jgi:Putative transmembrane protein (PGPGW)